VLPRLELALARARCAELSAQLRHLASQLVALVAFSVSRTRRSGGGSGRQRLG
jgi:hypothetical protein